MTTLRALDLKLSYRTGRDDLVREFFVPCLSAAVLYRRAAGYFTSAGLALAARRVANLALRRGEMRLVVSPYLEADDVAALTRARDDPAGALRAIVARSLAELEDALLTDRLNALAWLAAAGLLKVRLALRTDADGGVRRGLFHAKTGVFTDAAGDQVSFTGSANETAGGLVENFEHIEAIRLDSRRAGSVGRSTRCGTLHVTRSNLAMTCARFLDAPCTAPGELPVPCPKVGRPCSRR